MEKGAILEVFSSYSFAQWQCKRPHTLNQLR